MSPRRGTLVLKVTPLFIALAALSCSLVQRNPAPPSALASPVPSQSTPTQPTRAPLTVATRDAYDLVGTVRLLEDLILSGQTERIGEIVGPEGVRFAPFAVGVEYLGEDNSPTIADLLRVATEGHSPRCTGFNPDFGLAPSKAIVVFDGIAFDWATLGLEHPNVAAAGFHLWLLNNGWQLVFITPLGYDWDLESVEPLQPCP